MPGVDGGAVGALVGIVVLDLGSPLGSVGYDLGTDDGKLGEEDGDIEGTPVGSAVPFDGLYPT